ncbi:MAG: glycosyltransferase family 9 protein [Planctomycetota bacterium]
MSARLSGGERVLVRAPSWLGDFVAAEPAIRALVQHQASGGSVSIAAPARLLSLLDGRFPDLRRLPEGDASWHGHDVAVLLNGSFASAWRALRSRIGVRLGLARGGRSALLTHACVPARERGLTPIGIGRAGRGARFLPRPFGAVCAELFGWLGVAVSEREPRMLVSDRARARAEARLAAAGLEPGEPFILANAGARPGSAKGIPPGTFAAALDEIARLRSLPVVVACAPGEEACARETSARVVLARAILLDDPPPELFELAALSACARLAVGPDNGARHLAQAVGTPCVALCGPTDRRHTAEHPATTRFLSVEVPCGPCHLETCPLAGDLRHACMHRIEPARVAAAAAELLG